MKPIQFVASTQEVIDNLLRLHSYASGTVAEQAFHFDRLYNAEHQVFFETAEGPIFAPVKWCGAQGNSLGGYAERKRKISAEYQRALKRVGFLPIEVGHAEHAEVYDQFVEFCYVLGFKDSAAGKPHSNSRPRKFWVPLERPKPTQFFPDELPADDGYIEGVSRSVTVNAFERNNHARLACIAHHGWRCAVCDFDFKERYGDYGDQFIHVHHLSPLSEIREEYKVNPVTDLIPVCPNCHAMLHRSRPTIGIAKLKAMLR